jgi:glycosyltransferase involved in cell wall biosynthesis
VPYLDVEAMAERVLHLLRAPAERRAMGERGAARVRAHHTVDVAGPRLVAIIEDLLAADVAGREVR